MNLEIDLRTYMLAAATLAALVSTRVFGLLRPQESVLPAVMIQRVSGTRQVLFCGTNPLVDAQVQVDAYGMSSEDAWNVASAVRHLLVDFNGMMAATYVDHCSLVNEFPLVDPEPGIIRITQLYNIWYLED